jgi:hypothetical protein
MNTATDDESFDGVSVAVFIVVVAIAKWGW